MTLIDKLAYVVARDFTLTLMEAHDYSGWSEDLKKTVEGIKFEDLDEFIGILEADRNSGKEYDYGGEKSKAMWFYWTLTAIRNVKINIWLAKQKKKLETWEKGT